MNAVTVDVRMLRKGGKWCATARVCAPCLRAPVHLYASMDVKDAALMLQSLGASDQGGNALAMASANARKAARRQILGYTYNLFDELEPELRRYSRHVKSSLEACDKACDLVTRARSGDSAARTAIEGIFMRAKGGDADADRSARLILASAGLVDDGRTSFKVKLSAPNDLGPMVPRPAKRPVLELPPHAAVSPSTGAERTALLYPGTSVVNVPGKQASLQLVEDSWDALPYPADIRSDMQLLQNFQPAISAY